MWRLILAATFICALASSANAVCGISISGDTSGNSELCAPTNAGSSTPFTWPSAAGSDNDVIVTDGSGNLSSTNAPTFTGTNIGSGTLPASALTGQIPKANGGCAGTTGKACSDNIGVTYLSCNGAFTDLTGTTTETVVASCKIPANLLGATGRVRIFINIRTTGTNTKTLNAKYGAANNTSGTVCGSSRGTVSITTALGWAGYFFVINRGATNSNVCGANTSPTGTLTNTTQFGATSVDTTADSYFVVTGTLTNTGEHVTGKGILAIAELGAGEN